MNDAFGRIQTLIAVLSLCGVFSALGGEPGDKQDNPSLKQKMREMYDRIQPVMLYGKVVDTDGNAVPDAEVSIRWENADIFIGKRDVGRTERVKTDAKGSWTFSIGKAIQAYASAKKEGYETSLGGSTDNLIDDRTWKVLPAVITLRKRGEPTFLIVDPGRNNGLLWTVSNLTASASLDLLANSGGKRMPADKKYADVQAEASFDTTGRCWTVVYRATNGTDGIVLCDNFLYAAPEEGYQKEVVLQPSFRAPKYLYLRSRSPAVYSRVLLEHDSWREPDTGENFRIRYKAWINPYGERNLEADERVTKDNWRTRNELTEEAVQDIRSGRLPPKPDIVRRIRETDERLAREEAVKEKRHQEWLKETEKLKTSEKAK